MTTRMVWIRVARGLVVVLAVLATSGGSAWAAFPGRNGNIVYGWNAGSAYRAGPVATSIRTVDPRTGRVRVLRDCAFLPGGLTDCTVWGPRYSPDGLRIAFPTIRIQLPIPDWIRPWQYWPGFGTMASDGAGFQEHAAGNTYSSLAWSPAGNQLLLQRLLTAPDSFRPPDFSKPSAIFLAALDGTELSQVTAGGTSTPDWSTAGEIAFTRSRNNPSCPFCSDIYVVRLGGTPRRLTYRAASSPSWSPHGTKLAFVREDHSRVNSVRKDIYIVGRDGHGLRRLTRRGGYAPAWSPNGKWIAFIRANDLYVVRAAGGGLRRLVNAPTRDPLDPRGGFVTSVDWQPLPRAR